MDMKKRILLSMILLALCLIQASADDYYYQIRLYDEEGKLGDWSDYIKVESRYDDQQKKDVYDYGLRWLIDGKTVTDEKIGNIHCPKKIRIKFGVLDLPIRKEEIKVNNQT